MWVKSRTLDARIALLRVKRDGSELIWGKVGW